MGSLIDVDGIINFVVFLFILTVLVLVHELGHFVTARLAGVTVHEFGIGFPPRARVLFRRGETIYTLNWLPIGGFVRMEGEEPSPAEGTPEEAEAQAAVAGLPERESLDPHAFINQKLWKRLTILFAGAAVNFMLAWLIFTLVALVGQPTWQVRIGEIREGSPAQAAGLTASNVLEYGLYPVPDTAGNPTNEVRRDGLRYDDSGDLILAIDRRAFPVFDDLARTDTASRGRIPPTQYLADRAGQTVTLTVQHADGIVEEVEATLRTAEEVEAGLGALGFDVAGVEYGQQQSGPAEAAVIGLRQTVETSTLILRAVGTIIVGIVSGTGEGLDQVAGPVGMVSVIGYLRTEAAPVFLLWFVGLLSANLAVVNLLPIPPLDGSRMVMGVVQKVSGNRVSPATERLVYLTGWVALMTFLVFVTIGDIGRSSP